MTVPDLDKASSAYAQFLAALGIDETKCSHLESARNVAEMMADWTRGLHEDPPACMKMPAPGRDPVILKNLPFYSFCAHHFVPFFGTVRIVYVPDESIAGLGYFKDVVDYWAHRPQFQEDLCHQIAAQIHDDLMPVSVRVNLTARQMCLELFGSGQIEIESECTC